MGYLHLSSISTNDSLGQLLCQEQLLSEFQTSRQGLEHGPFALMMDGPSHQSWVIFFDF